MTKKEAKRKAWVQLANWVQGYLDCGYPFETSGNWNSTEYASGSDLVRMQEAMEDLILYCEKRGSL